MSLLIGLFVGLVAILWVWWVRVPDPPGKKAKEMGLSLIAAGVAVAVFVGILYGACSWISVHVGGQPLHM